MDAKEYHNVAVGDIIREIVKPTLARGGGVTDVLILLESVAAGVIVSIVPKEVEAVVMSLFIEGLKTCVSEVRAKIMNDLNG